MIHLTEAFGSMGWEGRLYDHVDAGNVTARTHPDLPLTIFNYTPQCAYNRTWDDVTLNCRGLILDHENYIVARPFPKFFNYGEPNVTIPDRPPHFVHDKMDGSLGIAYQYDGHIGIATRGSFMSDQALWATEWLLQAHPEWMPTEGVTDLFEIIYPDNRIVVNYGERRELVHLARIHNATGSDVYPVHSDWPGESVQMYATRQLEDLVTFANERDNSEGFVCVWDNDVTAPATRIKIKSDDYIAMHRIVTGLSNRIVWEHLGAGTIEQLRESVPDELYDWFDEQVELLQSEFDRIWSTASAELHTAKFRAGENATRGTLAAYVKMSTYPGLSFGLLDNKDIGPMIWKMIRPTRETPVLTVQEDT